MKEILEKTQIVQIICAQITAAGTIAAAHVDGVEVNQDIVKKNFERALRIVSEVSHDYAIRNIA